MSGFSAGRSGTKGGQDEKGGAGRGGDSASRTSRGRFFRCVLFGAFRRRTLDLDCIIDTTLVPFISGVIDTNISPRIQINFVISFVKKEIYWFDRCYLGVPPRIQKTPPPRSSADLVT